MERKRRQFGTKTDAVKIKSLALRYFYGRCAQSIPTSFDFSRDGDVDDKNARKINRASYATKKKQRKRTTPRAGVITATIRARNREFRRFGDVLCRGGITITTSPTPNTTETDAHAHKRAFPRTDSAPTTPGCNPNGHVFAVNVATHSSREYHTWTRRTSHVPRRRRFDLVLSGIVAAGYGLETAHARWVLAPRAPVRKEVEDDVGAAAATSRRLILTHGGDKVTSSKAKTMPANTYTRTSVTMSCRIAVALLRSWSRVYSATYTT